MRETFVNVHEGDGEAPTSNMAYMSNLIAPDMHPVAATLTRVRFIGAGLWLVFLFIAAVVAGVLLGGWWWVLAGVVVLLGLWLAWLIPAQVRNLRWLETEDEFLVSRGKIWHSLAVVPYGRIQFVDVTAGPIARIFDLKAVTLHTASSGMDVSVTGLPAAEANALRDRLMQQARERMSGL